MPGVENLVRIVVVSNDHIILDNFENLLDTRKFVLEAIATDPKSMAEIQKVEPDIFVVDSLGSDEEIIRICQIIRNYCQIPILVLAANHKPELVQQVLDVGADEFLIKPVSGSVLVAYLNTLTRRARAEKNAALSLANGESGENLQARLLTY